MRNVKLDVGYGRVYAYGSLSWKLHNRHIISNPRLVKRGARPSLFPTVPLNKCKSTILLIQQCRDSISNHRYYHKGKEFRLSYFLSAEK